MALTDLLMQIAIYGGAVVVGIFFIAKMFIKISGKTKILKRSDLEKKELIKSMELNTTKQFKELWHSSKFLGKIINYRRVILNPTSIELKELREDFAKKYKIFKETKDEKVLKELKIITKTIKDEFSKSVLIIVFKPKLIGKVLNPFKKEVLQIFDGLMIKEFDKKKLIIPADVFTDEFMGVFYDLTDPKFHLNIIHEKMFETDLDAMASVWYVKAQELSTFDPDKAHAMAMKEKELQIELARKRGKMTEI